MLCEAVGCNYIMKNPIIEDIDFKKASVKIKSAFPNQEMDFYRLVLATEILKKIIGKTWVNQCVFKEHDKRDKRNNDTFKYLESNNLGFQWQERVFRLADRLYNLRNTKNIHLIVDKIRQGEFLSSYSEIDAATHLKKRCIRFEFVEPKGKKTQDFDIRILESITVNCEVKKKIDSTEFSEKTIKNTLSTANKQLPKNNYGLIVIQIPKNWLEIRKINEEIMNVINPFFKRNSQHLIGILFRYEMPLNMNRMGAFGYFYKLITNQFLERTPSVENLLYKLEETSSGSSQNCWDTIDNANSFF